MKNIALIDDVEIDFTKGLNILTGETGAGKSIIIDSVNFALGARVPKNVVRDDTQYALSELVFYVDDKSTLEKLASMDIAVDDGEVILQRRIASGKSVCKINGESVPTNIARDVAALLIDIHGQHEHQSLLYKKNHKIMLDGFCGNDFKTMLCKLEKAYDEYVAVVKEYEGAVANSDTREQDLDYARFVTDEIAAANLKPGEDDELETKFARMNNSRKIAESIQTVRQVMSDDGEGAGSLISYALSSMKQISSMDDKASELYSLLEDTDDLVSEFNRNLASYEETLNYSPEEMNTVEERLDEINRLKMKYGQTIELIMERYNSECEKIVKLSDFEQFLNNLECKKSEMYDILVNVCAKISEIRKKEAATLTKDIVVALNNLNFLDARFEIVVSSNPGRITRDGYDDVEFMISTNPGEDLKPLTEVVSGGELSRIMLALKSVLAKRDSIGTLIFDEIDTGISGKTAQRVADRMSEIAADHQVICVTHLPQIASHATTHFEISKTTDGAHTSTDVKCLTNEESIEELARMLSGEEITEAVRKNAAEMKKAAMTIVE